MIYTKTPIKLSPEISVKVKSLRRCTMSNKFYIFLILSFYKFLSHLTTFVLICPFVSFVLFYFESRTFLLISKEQETIPFIRSTIDPNMCLETLGQFRSEENGSIECTSRQCRLKCDEGYQPYGAKSTVKCIRTKKVLYFA